MAQNEYPFGVGRLPAAALNDALDDLDDRIIELETAVTPTFALRRTTAQTVTTGGVGAPLGFATEDSDTHSGHDNVTNNTRYTIPRAGAWQIGGGCGWVANATGRRGGWWKKNGGDIDGSGAMFPATAASTITVVMRTIVVPGLVVGDYLEMNVFQDSGGNRDTSGTTFEQPTFWGRWLHY